MTICNISIIEKIIKEKLKYSKRNIIFTRLRENNLKILHDVPFLNLKKATMKTVLKIFKKTIIGIICLFLLTFIILLSKFHFWKSDIISHLPGESSIAETSKGQIEYLLKGNSKNVVLAIHGTPGSYQVSEYKPYLEKGYSFISFSRPGYYRTPLSVGKTPEEQADACIALLDKLGIDSVFVDAISGGGPCGVNFALRYPSRCRGLILKAAITDKFDVSEKMNSVSGKIFSTEFGQWLGTQLALTQLKDSLEKAPLLNYMSTGMFPHEQTMAGLNNDLTQFANLPNYSFEKILVPTLLIHGNKDGNVPFAFSKNASQKIPHAELFEMDGKSHNDFFLPYRDTINQKVIEFLDKIKK